MNFIRGDNDHIWFSEDGEWSVIKRFSVGDFCLYRKNSNDIFNWCERYFDGWDDIMKYLKDRE